MIINKTHGGNASGHILRIAIGMMGLVLLLAGGAGATTLTVNASGGANYTRIQDAINNASAGDTILVYNGTYHENVNVNKHLNLSGIGNPVVDAGGSRSAITLAADGIILEGFTVTGAGGGYPYPAAGIVVTSNNNTLSGNNVSNNYGDGISLSSSSTNTLSGNNVSKNAHFYGDGIALGHSSNNTLINNNVSNNGDGISLYDSSNNMLSGNNVSNNGNNFSYFYGDGISLSDSSYNTLTNNIMTGNKYNFLLDGSSDSAFYNQIDTSNLVDGKPIYYIRGASNSVYDSSTNAGTFYCINCVNVTIKNLNLNKNGNGIFFWNTAGSKIQNVNASNNGIGIYLGLSISNMLSGNNVSNNNFGIFLSDSSYNTLSGNNALNNNGGIYLWPYSRNNMLIGNNASNNNGIGIYLSSSSSNTLSGNNASNNKDNGINLYFSSSNTLSGNNASNNLIGISLGYSSINMLTNNIMTGNKYNFQLNGDSDYAFYNQIDTSNLVDVKPIYYIIGASNSVYDSSTNAGTFYCINCVNVTIKNLNLNKNDNGIFFRNTTRSKIQNVNASNNYFGIGLGSSSNNTLIGNNANSNYGYGIYLDSSSNNNTLSGNTASNNTYSGIDLYFSSNNNLIYNNYFNNTNNAYDDGTNIWNITKTPGMNIIGGSYLGGNFWSDYVGNDTDRDGLGDTLVPYNSSGNITNGGDFLPLTIPTKPTAGSISGMKFNDLNGNGIHDAEELGLANWTITLTNESGSVATNVTDASGNYSFTNLTDGNYIVGEVIQPGWIQTAPAVSATGSATYKVQISGGNAVTGKDFGNFQLGSVSGMKFEDLNANGVRDTGEAGLAGWQITITGKDTIENVDVTKTATTDVNGNYNFTGLTAGTYTIIEIMQPGWIQTAPSAGNYTVTITSGANITGQDFGNFHKGNITGGGWINITGDPKATFGIVGQYPDALNTAKGRVEYKDHNANLNVKSIQINTVATTLDKKKGAITGLATVNGTGSYPFVVYVEDNAEPGKGADVFRISLPTYTFMAGKFFESDNFK